jgi:Flp pilus assembly protein TadG
MNTVMKSKPGRSVLSGKSRRGQALILIVFAMIGLIAMLALAVDGGNAFANRSRAQSAADNAALAAALAIAGGNNTVTEVANAVHNITLRNGFSNSAVTIHNPPGLGCGNATSAYAGDAAYTQVVIRSTVQTYFGSIVGIPTVSNCVEATSHGTTWSTGSLFGLAGIVALSKTANPAIDFTSSVITVHGGGIFDNSSGSTALDSNWAPVIHTDGGCIGVVGGVGHNFTNGSQTITGPGFCSPKPAQIDIPDFAAMVPAPPAPPTCSGNGTWNSSTHVATPGNFTNISIPSGVTSTLQSGTYCFSGNFSTAGGPLTINGGDVIMVFTGSNGAGIGGNTTSNYNSLQIYTVNGNWSENGSITLSVPGVFRFFSTGTGSYSLAGGSTETFGDAFFYIKGGNISWNGSTNVTIHAPTYGPYKGIAIYKPITNTSTLTVMGGSNINFTGTILNPGGLIHMNGTSNLTGMHSQLIGNTIDTQGGSNMTITYNPDENIGEPLPATVELTK